MAKQSLVVVESAAKAKTIEKFLGRQYTVRACLGHVRDLPTSRLGVDVEHQFQPQYVVPKERKDVVKRLKDDARGKSSVLLATDPDREGEAIAWHLVSALGLDGDQEVQRIEFHEVTRGAVQDALQHPRSIDMHRVDAQQARRKLGFTARRTMVVAQQLYEGMSIGEGEAVGLITYMRTDSVNVAQVALEEARDYIRGKLADGMLPAAARNYKTRSKLAQEAHEAIRPTSVFREPEAVREHLTTEQYRLYDLVWKRFLASQMSSAVFDVTTVDVDAQAQARPKYRFRASGSRLKFAGFLSLYRAGQDEDEPADEERQPLPELSAGDLLDLVRLIPEQHFTQPPPRYSEATLVKALEERGIGRPTTYAPTLGTIQDRGYVERDGRRLKPTDLGTLVNDVLVQQFGDIVDLDFTAVLEDKLDEVAQGERPWVPVVQEFYEPLTRDLERANAEVERIKPAEVPTDEVCCSGHPMVIKEGRFGRFLACTQYPEHKETRPLPEELPSGAPEEKCSHGVPMQLRTGRYGPFYTSTHECGETKPFAKKVGVLCPVDGGEILEKHSRKGKEFFGCANYPKCDWVSWNRPLLEPCPQCGGLQVDMGRGRVRCLKHEGEPPRFVRNAEAN